MVLLNHLVNMVHYGITSSNLKEKIYDMNNN